VQGGQSTVGGGGRYDGLAELLGGRATPGVGFASGIERIILELKDQEVPIPGIEAPRVYFAFQNEGGKQVAFRLAESLRQAGIGASVAFGARRLNKQLDAANKSGAQLAVIIGEDELANATVSIKDLRNGGDQRTVAQAELVNELKAEHGPTH